MTMNVHSIFLLLPKTEKNFFFLNLHSVEKKHCCTVNVSCFKYLHFENSHFLNHQPSLITGMPPRTVATGKRKMNTSYRVDCFHIYPAAEFLWFCFQVPQFLPLLDSCLHYQFEKGHLVSPPKKTGRCCFASDLLNFHCSFVMAAAYSHGEGARKTWQRGFGETFRWNWTAMGKLGGPNFSPFCIYIAMISHFL